MSKPNHTPGPDDWRSRCDWCGWPLAETVEGSCVVNSCSERPMPKLGTDGKLKREVRQAENANALLLEACVESDRALTDACDCCGEGPEICETCPTRQAIIRVRTAIAAAKGETDG